MRLPAKRRFGAQQEYVALSGLRLRHRAFEITLTSGPTAPQSCIREPGRRTNFLQLRVGRQAEGRAVLEEYVRAGRHAVGHRTRVIHADA